MHIKLGADPEVFMKLDGKFISAYNMIPGDKVNPFAVNDGAVQVDGMALEFNIDAADDGEAFLHNITSVMAQLKQMVPEYEVVAVPVAEFGSEYIAAQPLAARELGCDPDYNAWSGKENVSPNEELPFRTGAGHVHLGWTEGATIDDPAHLSEAQAIVRQLDFFLGLPSLLYDAGVKRRSMYGAAGAFRCKPYGVEYRTLSNAWLQSEDLISWVYRASNAAVTAMLEGNVLEKQYGDIQDIINTSNVEAALEIIEAEGLEVPPYE